MRLKKMQPFIKLIDIEKSFAADSSIGNEIRVAFQSSSSTDYSTEAKEEVLSKVVLNKINLEIKSGDRIGIIGKNGAGKSTLLHIIGGITRQTAGELNIEGKVTAIFTLGTGLREDLSGRENIYIDGELKGVSRDEQARYIESIIDFADIGEFIDRPLKTYSTGMKARLAFAMITEIDPEILIIDEALSVGDIRFSQKATRRINEICAKGKIVMIVSHSMGSILTMCNRCIWLDNGTVVMDGDPVGVTEAYTEAVRVTDEKENMRRFWSLVGAHSFRDGYAIESLHIHQDGHAHTAKVLDIGSKVKFRIRIAHGPGIDGLSLRVKITRMDEYGVFDQHFNLTENQKSVSTTAVNVVFQPLVLAAAIYRIDVALSGAGQSLATSSDIFEVIQMRDSIGGKPMLIFPSSVSVKPRL
jgi:lipopolysaccharide transport system ATP-binding protein